jgi:hypothetical protein
MRGNMRTALMFLQFASVGHEQAERSSGNAAKQAVLMPELRRHGSLLPAYKKINRLLRTTGSYASDPTGPGR